MNDIQLSEIEWRSIFGKQDLEVLRNDLSLRRMVAEQKAEDQKRKNLVRSMEISRLLKMIPKALDRLESIIDHGDDDLAIRAAQNVVKPSVAYLEKHAGFIAEKDTEVAQESTKDFNVSYLPRSLRNKDE